MNKELEVLERFNNTVVVYGYYLYERNLIDGEFYRRTIETIDKDFNLLKEALKRNEPMKVDLKTECDGLYDCPNCKLLVNDADEFCSECGQKLDWRE